MTAVLQDLFERYGLTVRVERDGEGSGERKVFRQPLRENGKEYPFEVTELGTVDDRRWLCILRSELREGDRVRVMERAYTAVNCAAVALGEEISHWRAILIPEKEAAL